MGETIHRYRVVRLWEQSSNLFLTSPGLLPLAVLTQSSDPELKLRQVAEVLETITDNRDKRPRRKQRGIVTLFLTFHTPQGAGNLPVILLKPI